MKNFLFFILILLSFSSCSKTKEGNTPVQDTLAIEKKEIVSKDSIFGIEIDTLDILQQKVPNNKTLSDILSQYGISRKTIHILAEKSKPIFDVRKIRSGNNYYILQTQNDSVPIVKHFIYEISPLEYIVYSLNDDNVLIRREEKELEIRNRQVSGEIETSLWNAVVDQDIPFALALELSNIYAWNIDFFGLQKGDKFKVYYSEVWCDSSFIRIDSIFCAVFNHYGTDYHAIPYIQDNRRDFYDYEGNSLRKAFLKAPLSYSRISSTFTNSRYHPVLKIRRPHHGVDYAAPTGTPVSTIGDGRVIFKGYTKGGGNTIKIQHNGTYTTSYMHLSKYGKINVGSIVKQGTIIGYVGSTGLSTGPHLDFRVYENGRPINPLKLKSPPVNPVNPEKIDSFKVIRDSLLKNLDTKSLRL